MKSETTSAWIVRQTANHLKPRRLWESGTAQVLGKRITENVTSYHKFYSFFKSHNDNVTLPLRSFTKNNTIPCYISVKLAKFFKNESIMLKNVFRETQESRDVTWPKMISWKTHNSHHPFSYNLSDFFTSRFFKILFILPSQFPLRLTKFGYQRSSFTLAN